MTWYRIVRIVKARVPLEQALVVVLGVSLAMLPEFALLVFVFVGFWKLLKDKQWLQLPSKIIFVWFLLLAIQSLRTKDQFYIGFLQVVFIYILIVGVTFFRYKFQPIFRALQFGIFLSVLLTYYLAITPLQSPNWLLEAGLNQYVPLVQNEELYKAADSSNAWLGFDLALQGSGQLRFDIDVKSTQNITVGAFVNQATSGRWSQFLLPNCQVQTQWSTCKFQVTLESRAFTSVYFGGNNTWHLGSPNLFIRNVKYEVIESPQVIEYLIPQTRVKGLSFNENGFGAWMALLGLLALIAHRTLLSRVAAGAALLGLVLSGSQGALGALMFGVMVLMLWNLRSGKWLLLLISLLAIFFVSTRFLATNNAVLSTPVQPLQPTIRVLRTTPTESIQTRLGFWRLATKAWLENPRTFLIGTGDLTKAMKAKFDARSSSFGLTKDSLTHAHNLWIQTAGESGLVGLCAMLWLWGWVILRAWRSRDAGALALLAAIFVINSVDYLFFYAPVHLAFWMAAAGLKPPEATPAPLEAGAIIAS